MGCAASGGADRLPNEEMLARNANKVMKQDNEPSYKLLLLGAGASGKTTFRKQLRNIFSGFDETQRKESAQIIIENLYTGASSLLKHLPEDMQKQYVNLSKLEDHEFLTAPEAEELKAFFSEEKVTQLVSQKEEKVQLHECVMTFAKELQEGFPEWGGPDWVPSVEDCIRARVRSSGVAEEHFKIDGTVFKLFDAGGQRSERRKWIYYFDQVSSVLFMSSLTAYAENLFEDQAQNGLVEALELFDQIANSKWFPNTPMMLFFNKRDLFDDIFPRIPLNRSGHFPEAPETTDPEEAIEWIVQQFRNKKNPNPDKPNERPDANLYTHVTTAVSKDNVDKVFATCRTIILRESLSASGFVPT